MDKRLEKLASALSDRYSIERELGSGGMATVYLAEDRKHHRKVAIKVLLPELAHTIGVDRFLREIEVIAQLQHPHVLTLIDSGDVDGVPYYVMPFVEGQSLDAHMREAAPLSVDDALTITREIADGLHYAHQHGVIHRDIKPANILMSGGHAMIADFGIATALEHATMGRLTETGISLGSPIYMSPEQAAGERELDTRSDIYSLGCVLYELLSGTPPVADGSMQAVVTSKVLGEFEPLEEIRSDVPAGVVEAVSKALATQREDRFADARAFSDALAAGLAEAEAGDAAAASKATIRRRQITTVVVAVLVLTVMAVWFTNSRARSARLLWATQQLGQLELLASTAQYAGAFDLAEELEAVIPNDTTLERLRPEFTDFIPVRSDPPGATVYRQSYEAPIGEWELLGTTPLDSLAVPKSGSDLAVRLKIELEGYRTVELLPNVLAPWNRLAVEVIRLDREGEIPVGMVRVPGFSVVDPVPGGSDSLRFKDYLMGRYEVTNREYKAFVDAGGYTNREYWAGPFVKDGRELSWEEAMAEFEDQTGRPGPSTWRLGTYPEGQDEYPVGGVSFHEAAAYASYLELPTAWHWGRARRFNRETSWIVIPNSNLGGVGPRSVGEERSMSGFGVYDLAGNVREWCVNPMEGGRLTRGAAWTEPPFEVGWRIVKPEFDRAETNGFRLMQHFEDETTIAHLTISVDVTSQRDYRNAVPVDEREYAIYRRLYEYEPAPLNSVLETTGSTGRYEWHKVTFDAAYGGERAGAYVYTPKDGAAPYQSVIFWNGSGAMTQREVNHDQILAWTGFIVQSGRAVVLPLFKGSYERDDEEFSTTNSISDRNTSYYRELAIQWNKDLGRTIDYLETQEDFDSERIGFFGFSWGGQIAGITLAVEPRIKVAALDVGGLWVYGPDPLPEVEPLNFLPHITTPVIMLNGEHDIVFPLETGQRPFFDLLGTPPDDKRHVIFAAGHVVPRDVLIGEVLDWYDRYLGVP
jgi:dienelactone hydrolase